MSLRLNGSTSGYVELDAPATAGSNTLVLPDGNGTADQALVTNGSGTLSFADRGRMVLETEQASTSGTIIDFTGIPSWAKRVTVMFNGVGLSGTSNYLVQIGSGSISTSGYTSGAYGTNNSGITSSSGFAIVQSGTLLTFYGSVSLMLTGSNNWLSTHHGFLNAATVSVVGGGAKTLSGALDRIRITSANGTDTFDDGTINIMYEG